MVMPSAAPRLRYVSSIGALLTHPTLFADRRDAGRRLGERLEHLRSEDPVVLGLPRGGVPVAYEVALTRWRLPSTSSWSARSGLPSIPSTGWAQSRRGESRRRSPCARGARASSTRPSKRIVAREQAELERRQRLYRGDGSPVSLAGRTAVLVDDGVATGGTATAAAHAARASGARPRWCSPSLLAPPSRRARFAAVVDEFVCLEAPEGSSQWAPTTRSFGQTSDDEVRRLLAGARPPTPGTVAATATVVPSAARRWAGSTGHSCGVQEVEIPADSTPLPGDLRLPPSARGPRHLRSWKRLEQAQSQEHSGRERPERGGLATLLFDLLTDAEASARENVFDVTLLAGRLVAATHWAARAPGTGGLPVGYFGGVHGSGRRPLRCRRSGQRHPGGRFTWGPPGSGRITARRRDRSHPADRWRGRPGRAETQRGRGSLPAVPARARCGPGSDPPVRGARGA